MQIFLKILMSSQSIPSQALSASDPSIIITEENSRREQPADFTCRPVFNPVPSCGTNFLPVMVPDRDLEVKELPQQPLNLFHHFVPYFLVAKWVKYTNEWVDHLLRSRSWKPRARIRSWKPTTVPEVYLWLALLIHIGIHKEITIRDHWKTSQLGHQGSDHSILKVMTFDRFQLLHRHLRLFNPFSLAKEAAKAGLAKVFAAVDEWSQHLQYASTEFLKPGMNIAVDECMIRYTGRSYQTTRVPTKPIPVGFKIWATAQKGLFLRWLWHEPKKRYGLVSLGTRLRSQRRRRLYTHLNPTQSVVIALINKLPKAIYHVFIDNLFSSADLFRSLRHYGHGATGTARRNCGIYAPFAKLKDDDSAGRRLLQFNELRSAPTVDNKPDLMAEALGVASSVIAVVDLSAKVFSLCLQYSRGVKNAKGDIERLHKEVADFKTTGEQVQKLLKEPCGQQLEASQQLDSAINYGHATLEKLAQDLEPSTGRKAMSRFGIRALKWPFESKDIEGTIQSLARCRENVVLALSVDQTAILQKVDYNIALDRLPIAEGASFDSHAEEHNPTCLPDTRVDLLEDVSRWIADPNSKTIYWLNGMAGTGKSTISRTVARSRSKQGDLGASFFFKRGETDRENLAKFVPTLARQLAWSIPGVASVIKKAIGADPAIVGKAVREQFDKLIRDPLSEAVETSASPPSLVIVIDALDECEQDADIRLLINVLSSMKLLRPRLRVFLTSRPELPIRLGFSEAHGTYQDLVLHKIPRHIVEHDIFAFLADEFRKIRESFNSTVGEERKLPSDWPGQQTLQDLTQMAVPLFIFAATVCRFIDNRKRGNPQKQLREVLDQSSRSHRSQLDLTYGPVLRSQITDVSEDDRKQIIKDFRAIVGSIITLARPLSVTSLSRLLDVSPDVVDDRLDALHSVLNIPPTRTMPVRLLHLSFRDYLVGAAQKRTSEFWVDEKLAHRNLAKHCLRVMRGALRENICGLSFPGMRRSAVDDVQLEKCIPPQLQYAYLYWVHHQTKVDFEPKVSREVYEFLTTHFLHWLELLSLMNRAREGLDSLRSTEKI
ncbi:hypothetical protein NCS56_01538900 [Fusarium sp. Ph1]|nr:hypothetical protein NCS56_01538900 [Fusarium sp. Ph1]